MDRIKNMIDPKDYASLKEALEAANAQIETLERQSTKSNRHYIDLVENSVDSIFVVDIETGKIMFTNKFAAQRFGYTVTELIGKDIADIAVFDEPSMDSDSNMWMSRISGSWVSEGNYRHKDGYLIPVEVTSRIVEVNGRDHIQSFVRNIEARKAKQEKTLRRALERERVSLLTNFIQNTGHEFRTPLSIINNSAYLMVKLEDQAGREQRANLVQEQVTRITELVDMLQLLTKVESLEIMPEELVDLSEILLHLSQEMRSNYGDRPNLIIDISELLPEVPAKADYLKIAIRQLLINAYRFTPPNGTIWLTVEIASDQVYIEVRDNGHGIAEEDLPHIFETFWRQDEAHTTSGFGLGLSIALRIVEQHNGKIYVESEPGKGTCFRIELPLEVA